MRYGIAAISHAFCLSDCQNDRAGQKQPNWLALLSIGNGLRGQSLQIVLFSEIPVIGFTLFTQRIANYI
jgi:hypothetical protein